MPASSSDRDRHHRKNMISCVRSSAPGRERGRATKIDTYQILKIFTRSPALLLVVNPFETKVLIVITYCCAQMCHNSCQITNTIAQHHLFPYELFNLITLENHFQIHSNFGAGAGVRNGKRQSLWQVSGCRHPFRGGMAEVRAYGYCNLLGSWTGFHGESLGQCKQKTR